MGRWQIRKEEATATFLATTQRLVIFLLEPTLNRRYTTNNRMLQYFRIQTDMFMDSYFVSKKLGPSMRGFTCALVLCCCAAERRGKILASTSRNIYSLGGQVPATVLTGQQTDISALAETVSYK